MAPTRRILFSFIVPILFNISFPASAEFIKVSNSGKALPRSATLGNAANDWACTYDSTTKLIWEVKTNDGGLRDEKWQYTWFVNFYFGSFIPTGTESGTTQCKTPGRCDTEKFTADVNTQSLCGGNDWRLPSQPELLSLRYCSLGVEANGDICISESQSPTIDRIYFPSTGLLSWFWSSSAAANNDISSVNFFNGLVNSYAPSNPYQVRLVRSGLSFDATLIGQNIGPTASFIATPKNGTAPLSVNLNASGSSDQDGKVVAYNWKTSDNQSSTGQTTTFSFTKTGTYTITLTITDDKGATATAVQTISVTLPVNSNPIANFSATPLIGSAPLLVNVDASPSRSTDNKLAKFSWKSSDGQTASGINASFKYTKVGVFSITLSLTDTQGRIASLTKNITVTTLPALASASFVAKNDTAVEALPILVNDIPVQQLFHKANDVDWYEFYVKNGLAYTIEIPSNSIGGAINPSFQLFNEAGGQISDLIRQTTSTKGLKLSIKASLPDAIRLWRLKVTNQPPNVKSNDVADNSYQLKIYLTDAPQQGIIKGNVLNSCNGLGINRADVSALLGGGLTDSTLTFKTGEFGLVLNPDQYQLKSVANQFITAMQPVTLTQEAVSYVGLNQAPVTGCQAISAAEQAQLLLQQQEQAVAVFDDVSNQLVVRDVLADQSVYYAELQNIGNYRFQLTRSMQIPGIIHAIPGEYGATPLIATLPTVFALGKTWNVKLRNQGNFLFTLESAE